MSFTPDSVRQFILSYGPLGPVVSVALMVLHSLVPFPSELVTFANGMVYGPVWGTALTWVGAMLGAFLAFAISRWGGRPLAQRFVPARHLDRFDRWVSRYGVAALLVLRLLPIVSFNLVNYAAGLTRISWWTFTWTTAAGILPMTLLMVAAADQFRRGHQAGLWVLASFVALGGLLALFRRRQGDGEITTPEGLPDSGRHDQNRES